MKNRRLLSFFMVIVMMICLLMGCKNSEKTHLPDTWETDTSVAESASKRNDIPFSFADISNLEFWFGSGAGAWRTVLTVHEDGTFEGEYLDDDMDRDYPNGIQYLCDFTGKFTEPEKLNDYTYSVKIEQIELKEKPDTEEIKDGKKYIYSEPYGLNDAEELLFYMPGAPIQELPDEYKSWMMGYQGFTDTRLPFYGLYNVNAGTGFSSHEQV